MSSMPPKSCPPFVNWKICLAPLIEIVLTSLKTFKKRHENTINYTHILRVLYCLASFLRKQRCSFRFQNFVVDSSPFLCVYHTIFENFAHILLVPTRTIPKSIENGEEKPNRRNFF